MATYNRSDVLAHAIRSVTAQTFSDWALLVIGDACTDDTGEVVASFRDERISYVNRLANHGEQSMPNNAREAPMSRAASPEVRRVGVPRPDARQGLERDVPPEMSSTWV